MSGPIVRKYGFPNFENIFGKRDLQHGVDGPPPSPPDEPPAGPSHPEPKPAEPGKASGEK